MATIRFVRGEEREFVSMADRIAASPELQEAVAGVDAGELAGSTFVHHPGSADSPRLIENVFPPGTKVAPHAHDADEIIVVTAGQIRFGKQTYGPGSSIHIPKFTLYGFDAGPDGLAFLNFRPTHSSTGASIVSKDDLMERRRSRASAAENGEGR